MKPAKQPKNSTSPQTTAHRILVITPPVGDRISDHDAVFAQAGFDLCTASFGKADPAECQRRFDEILRDWGGNLVGVIHPQTDICDRWFKDAIAAPQAGNVKDFIRLFMAHNIPARQVDMDWGGPFDDEVCIYRCDISELLNFANAARAQWLERQAGEVVQ